LSDSSGLRRHFRVAEPRNVRRASPESAVLLGLLCGASIGREGPTVQVGAAFMPAAAKIGGMGQARGLILAGSAAGIAAAFNTPLAGVVSRLKK
jgi:H+/Cl- antiporter ClcA